MSDVLDHVTRNRGAWDGIAAEYEAPGHRGWADDVPRWGIWHVPDSALHVLPDVSGLDVVELGCGTAYVSAWMARRGARVVGIDNSRAQLTNARKFQREFGLDFPLIHANAEEVPLVGGAFDLAISEYGACLWCDPYRWIPEAARLLRPGGRLIFLTNSALVILCSPDLESEGPAREQLVRDYFGMYRFEWPDFPGVEFHLGHGDWIRLLRGNGFEIDDLIELRPDADAESRYAFATLEWSRRWPCEEVWKARKKGQ